MRALLCIPVPRLATEHFGNRACYQSPLLAFPPCCEVSNVPSTSHRCISLTLSPRISSHSLSLMSLSFPQSAPARCYTVIEMSSFGRMKPGSWERRFSLSELSSCVQGPAPSLSGWRSSWACPVGMASCCYRGMGSLWAVSCCQLLSPKTKRTLSLKLLGSLEVL